MGNCGGRSTKTFRGIEHLGPSAEISLYQSVPDSPDAKIGAHQKLLLRRREAAEMLSLSERKLWSLTSSGGIPHIRIGRSVRYPVDELRQWILEQTKGGAER